MGSDTDSDRPRVELVRTFDAPTLEEAAALVERALGVTLYAQQSPMMGPWYSDVNIAQRIAAVRAGDALPADEESLGLTLSINDPEPGVAPVAVAGGKRFVVRLKVAASRRAELESLLERVDSAV